MAKITIVPPRRASFPKMSWQQYWQVYQANNSHTFRLDNPFPKAQPESAILDPDPHLDNLVRVSSMFKQLKYKYNNLLYDIDISRIEEELDPDRLDFQGNRFFRMKVTR